MTGTNNSGFDDLSMLALFRTEIENHCATLSDNLLELEQSPDDPKILESLMRAAHSAKGAARIIDVPPIVALGHAMEDIFVASQNGTLSLAQEHIDALLRAVDYLTDISNLADDKIAEWLEEKSSEIVAYSEFLATIAVGDAVSDTTTLPSPEPQPSIASAQESPSQESSDFQTFSMFDLFRQEAESNCEILTENLLLLENDPSSPEIIESLMRAAHSLKGAARIVELNEAVEIAHAMEDVFVACQYGTFILKQVDIDGLLKGVDLLHDIADFSGDSSHEYCLQRKDDIHLLLDSYKKIISADRLSTEDETELKKKESLPVKQKAIEKKAHVLPPAAKKPARRAEDKDGVRALRISAENMSRLMGLAGEMLIESRWLPTFSSRLYRLKSRQDDFLHMLDALADDITSGNQEKLTETYITELRKKIEEVRSLTIENIAIVDTHGRHSTEISHRLYHEAISSRMQPFSLGVKAFPRLVRDLSKELGKKVKLEIIGNDTPVDRDILEKIESPLNHLIRNSLDHGIEDPEERIRNGKPAEATIRLEARHRAGMLNIIVADDGGGIDVDKIRQTVIEKKLVAEDIALALTNSELIEFLFLPNFSTKKTVSKVSGRGVGMDVVHSVVHEVRGVIYSSTELHVGTKFELQLPLTLSVMRALIVEIGREPYGLPLVNIEHIVKIPKKSIKELQGRQYFTFNEKRIGLVSAAQVLQVTSGSSAEVNYNIVIFSDRMNQYGLIVERFWGIRDLVVQAIDDKLGKIKDISSASLLEDGTPVLILDVEDMVRSMDILISDNRLRRINAAEEVAQDDPRKRILVADDSITVREVERKMLSNKGYRVEVAVDGMDAWNSIRENKFDLIITDVDMPRMDGIELVKTIKSDPKLEPIPIIIVSYKDREEDRTRGLEAGADYYLTKGSFQDETLVNAVRDLIGTPV